MHKIGVFKTQPDLAEISPLSIKREWMDATWNAHAYHCFPVSLTNQMGWGISFPEDISFIWDGISDTSPDHVKILKGSKYAAPQRANATVSFNTGLRFLTDNNMTLLTMPVPNQFIDGAISFSTLISTSFFSGDLPIAWRITRPNVEITIPANTPIASVVPINLEELNNSEINVLPIQNMPVSNINNDEYSNHVYEVNKTGKWTDFYRNGTDHKGNQIGSHQVKTIKLFVK
jgi:hypothetical protein